MYNEVYLYTGYCMYNEVYLYTGYCMYNEVYLYIGYYLYNEASHADAGEVGVLETDPPLRHGSSQTCLKVKIEILNHRFL